MAKILKPTVAETFCNFFYQILFWLADLKFSTYGTNLTFERAQNQINFKYWSQQYIVFIFQFVLMSH